MASSADKPSVDAATGSTVACRHCGRVVGGTVHTRTSYVVDGFVLHTGPSEPAVGRRSAYDEVGFVYQRLLRPVTLVTCADCWADPVRRAAHLSWIHADD
jgi:hypothetical protein